MPIAICSLLPTMYFGGIASGNLQRMPILSWLPKNLKALCTSEMSIAICSLLPTICALEESQLDILQRMLFLSSLPNCLTTSVALEIPHCNCNSRRMIKIITPHINLSLAPSLVCSRPNNLAIWYTFKKYTLVMYFDCGGISVKLVPRSLRDNRVKT